MSEHYGKDLMLRVQYRPWEMGYGLYIMARDQATNKSAVGVVTFRETGAGVVAGPDERILMSDVETQGLMDSLWDAGIRPKSVGSAGHLAATEAHLKDMQKLVFDRLLPVIERGRK